MMNRTCRGVGLTALALVVLSEEPLALAQQPAPAKVDVIVQGEKVRPPAPPKDRSVAGSVIPEERLRGAGLQAADVLRTQPGLTVVETGGQGALSTASLRGATAAQTPVYLGGVRLNDDVAGTADLSLIPLWLLERVEVYRGNAPLEADQLGIGGAIFFEPRRPRKTGAGVGLSAGSYGARAGWGWASAGDRASSALAGARLEEADNNYSYVDDRGTRFNPSDDVVRDRANADTRTADLWTLSSTSLGQTGSLDLTFNAIAREQGVPGLSLLPTRLARSSQSRTLGAARLRIPCGSQDRCLVTATTAGLVARSALEDPAEELLLGSTRLDTQGARGEQSLSVRVDINDWLTLTPVVRAAVEQLRILPLGGEDLALSRVFSRGALGSEWRLSQLVTVRALASAECNGTSASQAQFCDRVDPSARGGVQFGRGKLVLLANAGRYVRVPTLGELYGVSGLVRGNAALEAEQGMTFDAGVRATAGRAGFVRGAFADLFAFVRVADDLVAWRRSSMGYVRPYNVGSARVSGLEWLGAIEAWSFLRLEIAATLLDPRSTTSTRTTINDLLPFRSRLVIAPLVELRAQALRSQALLRARYVYQSSRYADEAGLVVIPEQGTLDLEAELRTLADQLALRVRLANAFAQKRFDVIGYALAGRAVYGTIEVRW